MSSSNFLLLHAWTKSMLNKIKYSYSFSFVNDHGIFFLDGLDFNMPMPYSNSYISRTERSRQQWSNFLPRHMQKVNQ